MIHRLALLCGLSLLACVDPPEVDGIASDTVQDPTCSGFDLKLYTGTNYSGQVLCLQEFGSFNVARLSTIGSYKSGQWSGVLDHGYAVPPVPFALNQNVPVVAFPANHANIVYITGPLDGGIDSP